MLAHLTLTPTALEVEAPSKRTWVPFGCGDWAPPGSGDSHHPVAVNWNHYNHKRILGTVPVEDDGSALFRVPADTPLAVQAFVDLETSPAGVYGFEGVPAADAAAKLSAPAVHAARIGAMSAGSSARRSGVIALLRPHRGEDVGQLPPVTGCEGESRPPFVQARIPEVRRYGGHPLRRGGCALDRGPQRQLGQDAAALVLAPGERVSHGLEGAPGRVGIAAGQAA